MKRLLSLFAVLFAPALAAGDAKNCGCGCCQGLAACCCQAAEPAAAAKPAPGSTRHPLRGVVVAVQAEESAIMVKHEEIPGVMRAMTMLFKVDAAALKLVRKGATITAQMSRQGNEWWLHEVKVVDEKKG